MKKDRNTFFQNQSASSYFYPGNNINIPQMGYPIATESNSNFYQGPAIMPQNTGQDYNSELESRLAKIERQINRLDSRITKLESEVSTDINTNYNGSNMYMV